MIDIHSHILPGLDDGPSDLEEAVEMARVAARAGVTGIVAAPHAFSPYYNVSPDARDSALKNFDRELKAAGVPMRLFAGFECLVVENFIERLHSDPRYFMPIIPGKEKGRNRHVLIELGRDNPVECLDTLLFDCQRQGITPVLAHPERCPEALSDPSVIEPFVQRGGELQITADNLVGFGNLRVRRVCEFFLKKNLVAYIASDAHCRQDYMLWAKAMRRAGRISGFSA